MPRTKHAFLVVALLGVTSVLSALFAFRGQSLVPTTMKAEVILAVPQEEYSVVKNNEDTRVQDRNSFIAKIRSALLNDTTSVATEVESPADTTGEEEPVPEAEAVNPGSPVTQTPEAPSTILEEAPLPITVTTPTEIPTTTPVQVSVPDASIEPSIAEDLIPVSTSTATVEPVTQ
jgi:hypothetical protein